MEKFRIFLVGGGTGGPIAPLLAVAEELRALDPKIELFFAGTGGKLEKQFLDNAGLAITNLYIPAGKWRRYFSLLNFTDLFKTFFGFLRAWYLLGKYRPAVVFGAGSYAQVPVMWAAWLRGVPVVAHQQDLEPLLSTRLVAPVAKTLTVSFEQTVAALPEGSGLFKKAGKSKVVWTGNPVRREVLSGSTARARKTFSLSRDYPTLLVMGGGTGSEKINSVLAEAVPELLRYFQVIHVTGSRPAAMPRHAHYHGCEFLTAAQLRHAYAVADLAVCRAGMSTIAELSALGKAAMLVPLPQSPQEDNVDYLVTRRAVIGISQDFFTAELLVNVARKAIWSKPLLETLRKNIRKVLPTDAAEKIAALLIRLGRERYEQ